MTTLKPLYYFLTLSILGLMNFPRPILAQENPTLFITRANAKIARESAFKNKWDGPVSGPKMVGKKRIIFIGSDFADTSVSLLMNGTKEAAAAAGWEMVPINCYGLPNRRADAFSQAMALKPDGIILAGINAQDQTKEMAAVAAKKIPVVGWHASDEIGPTDGMFTNLGTNPREVGQTAAFLAIADSNGKANVVVLTDPTSLYSVAKSNEIADAIRRCQSCKLLGLEEIPISGAADKRAAKVTELAKRYEKKWTYLISTHDLYIDWLEPAVNAEAATNTKPQAISAGDGSPTSYQRISKKAFQLGVVPEPLIHQGWQIIDELNRAQQGMPPSAYATPVYVVTGQNIGFHGGPKNQFDPDYDYRSEYKKIWGK